MRIEGVEDPVDQGFDEVRDRVLRAYSRRMMEQHRLELVDEVFADRHGVLNEAYFRGEE